MSPQYGELQPTNGWDRFRSLGHPCKFQQVSRLGSVPARHSSSGRQPNFAALNRGRRLYMIGRPARWALAHILLSNILSLFILDSQFAGICSFIAFVVHFCRLSESLKNFHRSKHISSTVFLQVWATDTTVNTLILSKLLKVLMIVVETLSQLPSLSCWSLK